MIELNDILKFDLIKFENEEKMMSFINGKNFYLIISKKRVLSIENQLVLDSFPLKISELIEKINLSILKYNFSLKSHIKIKTYDLDLNSRVISLNDKSEKLTEQEVKLLLYLNMSSEPQNIEKLQKDIWGYGQNLETHTVETHIHRLRKKFLNAFNDKKIILSTKKGYSI